MNTRLILNYLVGGACAALAACGGGGGSSGESGGSGPPPATADPLPITDANYLLVAQESLSSTAFMGSATALASGAQAAPEPALFDFARGQAAQSGARLARSQPQATGADFVEDCPSGGSLRFSVNDANGNNQLDAGDAFSFTYSDCGIDGVVYNGSLSFLINGLSGQLGLLPYAASLTVGFHQLTAQSAPMTSKADGQVAMQIRATAADDLAVSVTTLPSFTESVSAGGAGYSRTLSGYTVAETVTPSGAGNASHVSSVTVIGTLGSSVLGGRTVGIASQSPFVRNSWEPHPASGQALVTGANHSQVRITVLDASSVSIELDANGDGSPEQATTRLWDELV